MVEPINVFTAHKGDVISFVGAGGKTSLIKALASALKPHFSVAITTTTHMYPIENLLFENHLLNNKRTNLNNISNNSRIPVFFSTLNAEGKGLPPCLEDFETITMTFDIVLIEADGARGKSLKLPRAHEPVVPENSNKVVLVIGLDIFGKPQAI